MKVGDAQNDQACWERPEDRNTPRSVINRNNPGTEFAVALAAASMVFRRSYSASRIPMIKLSFALIKLSI